MSEEKSLEERVNQFRTMQLPGQPMGMHMGTANLVNDLWRSNQELCEALRELHAMVWGECPSLFDEDSGGTPRTDIAIRQALINARGTDQ